MEYFFLIIGFIILAVIAQIWQEKINNKKIEKVLNEDERMNGAHIFHLPSNSLIAINENGYLALKNEKMKDFKIVSIKDLNGFEVITNGHSTANIGGALAGGLLFGGVGALVGGLGSKKEKITNLSLIFKTNDFKDPVIEIKLSNINLKKGSLIHKQVEEELIKITSLLEIVEKKFRKN